MNRNCRGEANYREGRAEVATEVLMPVANLRSGAIARINRYLFVYQRENDMVRKINIVRDDILIR